MNIRKYLADFALTFIFAFVAGVFVTFALSLLVHGQGIVDWETAYATPRRSLIVKGTRDLDVASDGARSMAHANA